MAVKILEEKVSLDFIRQFGKEWYPDFLKGCVDVDLERVSIGGEYHIESCEAMTDTGSSFGNVWGFNIKFTEEKNILEFESLVNIKPAFNNRSRKLENEETIKKADQIIRKYIEF